LEISLYNQFKNVYFSRRCISEIQEQNPARRGDPSAYSVRLLERYNQLGDFLLKQFDKRCKLLVQLVRQQYGESAVH